MAIICSINFFTRIIYRATSNARIRNFLLYLFFYYVGFLNELTLISSLGNMSDDVTLRQRTLLTIFRFTYGNAWCQFTKYNLRRGHQ